MIGTATDALDPIEAVALHDGHPELMPGGGDVAAITRGLADRLAGLDLIEPATRLYDEALQSAPAAERAETGAKLADPRLAAGDDAGARKRADLYWRDSNWDLAARDYLRAAESQPDDDAAAARKARPIPRATAALPLADKRTEVAAVKDKYGPAPTKSAVAAVFDKITAPDAGIEVLTLPDVPAEIVKID